MNMNGARVLVTGGAGVIGTKLVPQLVRAGAYVTVGDLKPRPRSFPIEVTYRQGDLNYLSVREFEHFAPEILIHLAAAFERSTETPAFWTENFQHNVTLSHHLMGLARDVGSVHRVVYASSYLVYDPALYIFDRPQSQARVLVETDPLLPRNLTGMAKLAHELELRFLDRTLDDPWTSVSARIFRGYGPGSRCVISRWIRSLLAGEPIDVYRPEGRFDFIYGADSAEGIARLAASDDAQGIVNLGTGDSRPVTDILDSLAEHFPNMNQRRVEAEVGFEASEASTTRLEQLTDWKPERTIEDTIPEIIEFERKGRTGEGSSPQFSVLVTSGSTKVPLLRSVEQAAAKLAPGVKVIAGDSDETALVASVAEHFVKLPPTTEEHLDDLVRHLEEHGVRAIVPTRDGELEFLARNAHIFRNHGVVVMVSPPETIRRCLDKLEFAQACSEAGAPTIPTCLDLDDAALGSGPYVVKERFGAGAESIGLGLSATAAMAWADGLEYPVFQPYIEGTEMSVDAYISTQGSCKGVVIRTRDEVIGGESRITTTIEDDETEEVVRSLLLHLEVRGHAVTQVIRSDDEVRVIECNPRVGGASTLTFAAGLDSLWWFLLEASGVDVDGYPFLPRPAPLRLVRVPHDIIQ